MVVSAGYSKKSLIQKLGIREGFKIAIINAPVDYAKKLGKLPLDVVVRDTASEGKFDFIHFFTKNQNQLETEFPRFKNKISQNGMLWISWPKQTSREKSDLNDNVVRKIGLDNEMVDVKVAAIDETWSGLKFVFRIKDRKSNPQSLK
jgi:hypothetical protein